MNVTFDQIVVIVMKSEDAMKKFSGYLKMLNVEWTPVEYSEEAGGYIMTMLERDAVEARKKTSMIANLKKSFREYAVYQSGSVVAAA